MLHHIRIRQFATLPALDIDLHPGLTVLTGETGAGKSMLLDAVGLLLGKRADSKLVRQGAKRADIESLWQLKQAPELRAWLQQADLDDEDDSQLQLRRVVGADGRSRAFINGHRSTLEQLKELAGHLVELHGQHAHMSLLQTPAQRDLLDRYAGHATLQTTVAQTFADWQSAQKRLADLDQQRLAAERLCPLLDFEIQELTTLAPEPGEYEALHTEQRQLRHHDDMMQLGQHILEDLEGKDASVAAVLLRCMDRLHNMQAFCTEAKSWADMLEEARIQIDEVLADLQQQLQMQDNDPQRLLTIESRLSALHDTARKYRSEPEQLAACLQEKQRERAALAQQSGDHAACQQERDAAQQRWQQAASALSASRLQHGQRLQQAVCALLPELGMEKARFAVCCETATTDEPRAHGQDALHFQLQTHPGMPAGPLHKVASGGELSRIGLALRILTAADSPALCWVFDEVDVGIGGATAESVGRLLQQLARHRQVLCITHLPQVAVFANQHWRVHKQLDADNAETIIEPLPGSARIHEIARMLAGSHITDRSLEHARELLQAAATISL